MTLDLFFIFNESSSSLIWHLLSSLANPFLVVDFQFSLIQHSQSVVSQISINPSPPLPHLLMDLESYQGTQEGFISHPPPYHLH